MAVVKNSFQRSMATWLQSSIFIKWQYRCLIYRSERSPGSYKSTSAVLGVGSSQPASIRAVCMRSRGWDRDSAALGLSTTLSLSGEAAARASPRRLKLQVRLSLVLYCLSCVLRDNFVLFECSLCFFGSECYFAAHYRSCVYDFVLLVLSAALETL